MSLTDQNPITFVARIRSFYKQLLAEKHNVGINLPSGSLQNGLLGKKYVVRTAE